MSSFAWGTSARHDLVATAHHVVGGCLVLVSLSLVLTSGAGVVTILAETMSPAVAHFDVVVS